MEKKRKESANILSQEELADGIFSMWIQTDAFKDAKPGQFINLFTNDQTKLLPRPLSICEINRKSGALRVVYRVTGKDSGTAQFSKLTAMDTISVMGPLGNGFPTKPAKKKRALIIGGGIGIPPLLELAKQVSSKKTRIILGYKDSETFLSGEFEEYGKVSIATEDGSEGKKGTVMDVIADDKIKADVIYACGPTPMLKAVQKYAKERKNLCYLSLEERMACGVGACLSCVCASAGKDEHSNNHNKRVCKDGPVFLSTEVKL